MSIETVRYCERECARGDGTLHVASHGRYCTRCWSKLDVPLSQAGELATHLIGNMIQSGSGSQDRVDSTREAPLPFNQSAFDDANELYSMLVYWCEVWAQVLETVPPTSSGAWKNQRGTIVGLPSDVDASTAGDMVGHLASWLQSRLDAVLSLIDYADDIDAFTDQIGDVWRMNARWPRIERPSYSAMPCPREDCGAKMAVYPPTFQGDARRIVCTSGHWYPEEEYEHLRLVFEQVLQERRKSAQTAAHLARKYNLAVGA